MPNKNVIETLLRFKSDISDITKATEEIQKQFGNLKPTANFEKSFLNTLSKLQNEIGGFEAKAARGVSSMADARALEQSGRKIIEIYDQLKNQIKVMGKLSDTEMQKLFPDSIFANAQSAIQALKKYQSEQDKVADKISEETKLLQEQKKTVEALKKKKEAAQKVKTNISDEEYSRLNKRRSTAQGLSNKAKNTLDDYRAEIQSKIESGELKGKNGKLDGRFNVNKEAIEKLKELEEKAQEAEIALQQVNKQLEGKVAPMQVTKQVEDLQKELNEAEAKVTKTTDSIEKMKNADAGFKKLLGDIKSLTGLDFTGLEKSDDALRQIQTRLENMSTEDLERIKAIVGGLDEAAISAVPALGQLKTGVENLNSEAKELTDTQRELENFKNNILQFFSIGNAVQLFKRAVSSAIQTVKELDAAMTEIAVVSDFDIGDMWDKLPEFTDQANKLGVAVKDMYSATTLYIQQGLNMNDSLALSNQTMKMARIAGLEAADATDAMTAALRGFNMELNETSAENVADVYAKLAAITAADVSEISTAMTKTASIASNANMEFETTAAFLSQIIETTRESAETAGTAMKTVIARFQELKKDPSEIGEVDGEIVDVNKIETALRSIGVALRDSEGQFRDLDDVFLEIAKKWDSLDTNTQRYIATMAAGSRQQSRFIAMMSNYERTMELVGAANNSAGASQEQFDKTLKSLEAKLARLKNAWDEFTTGIANNELIKFGVDVLTKLLELVNKLSSGTGDFGEALIKLGLGYGAIKGGGALLKNLFGYLSGSPVVKDAGAGLGAKFIEGFKTKITDTKTISQSEQGLKKFFAGFKKINTEEIEKTISMPISDAFENIGNGVETEQLQKNLRDALIGNEKNIDEYAYKLINADIDEGTAESLKEANNLLKDRGAEIKDIEVKTTKMSQKNVADWRAIGAATAAAGMAISGVGKLLENSGFEKLGKTVSAVGAALTTVGTLMSVVIPMAADKMAKKTIASIMSIPYVREIALILAAITAVGTAVYASITHAERETKALEERISALREAGKEATKQYEEGLSSFKKYQELSDIYDDAIVGTQSWRDSLIEVNEAALALLEIFPELEKYVKYDSNGKISFTEGADEYFESLNKRAQNYSRATLGVEAYKTSNSFDNLRQEKAGYSYNLESSIEALKQDINTYQEWARQAREAGDEDTAKNYEDDIARFKEEIAEKERLLNIAMSPIATEEAQANREVESQVAGALVEGMSQEMQDSEFGYDLANAMARNVSASDYQEKIDAEISRLRGQGWGQPNYKKELKEKYGYTDEQVNKMSRDERRQEYATLQILDQMGEELKGFYENLKKLNKDQQKMASRVLKGSSGYSKAMADDVTKLFGADGAYDQEQVAEWYKKTTGLSLEEAAANLGITVGEYIEQLRLDAEEAAVAFEEAKSTLAKVGVDFAHFDQYDISSSTLNAFADQIYSAFLDLGPEAARGLFNSFSSAIDQATPEQKDAVMAALAQVDLSSYSSVTGFMEQFEILAKSAGITSDQVAKLKGEMIAFAGVVEEIDAEKIKESAKSLEDIGKRIEKDPTNYVFSGDDKQQLLDKGIANETDFIATGVDEWVYIGGSMESLLASINTNVYGILGKMETSSYAIERGAAWEKAKDTKIVTSVVGSTVETIMNDLATNNFDQWKNRYSMNSLNWVALATGAYVNQDGTVASMADFANEEELASFLVTRYNEYYGANGLAYKTNQEEYDKQLKQQAANEAQAEMIQMMSRSGLGLIGSTVGGFAFVNNNNKKYILAKAAEMGVDQELIDEAKRTYAAKDFLNLIDAISQKETLSALTKTAKGISEITEKYEDLTKIKPEDVHSIGDLLGLDTRSNAQNFNFIKNNLDDLSLAMQGDAEAWNRFLNKIVLTKENVADLVAQGFYTVTTKTIKKGQTFTQAITDEEGNIIDFKEGEESTTEAYEYQVLGRTSLDTLAFATGNMEGIVETEDISLEKNFNELQKINAEQRKRIQLEREYEKLLKSENTTAEELSQNLNARMASLTTERDIVESLYSKEEADLEAKLGKTKVAGVSLEKINGQFVIQANYEDLSDSQKEEAQDYVKELEEQIDLLNELDDQLISIDNEVEDIANTGRDDYLGLEERLTNALVNKRQEELDALREINDSINDAATDLMDAVQSNIDKMRQDRENEKTENEIAEKERRLAYLRQDTSGANAAEIKSLEKEIAQQKEGYGDSLIDQALSDMQKQNEEAAKQREEQLQKQQEAHDLMVENGGYAKKAMGILAETLEKGTAFDKTSEFYKTLYGGEKGSVLTDAAYEKWMEDLVYSVNSASVYNNSPLPKTEVPAGYSVKADDPQIMGKMLDIYRDKGRITKDILILNELRNQKITEHPELYDESMKILTWYDLLSQLNRKYATGGIADFTGPAWLDGTKSHPELVLNARDTENFILLKDALSKAVNGGLSGSSDNGGDNYFDITIEVDEIGSDYDVDQMAARIKQQIYEDSAYRNVNTINFLR